MTAPRWLVLQVRGRVDPPFPLDPAAPRPTLLWQAMSSSRIGAPSLPAGLRGQIVGAGVVLDVVELPPEGADTKVAHPIRRSIWRIGGGAA